MSPEILGLFPPHMNLHGHLYHEQQHHWGGVSGRNTNNENNNKNGSSASGAVGGDGGSDGGGNALCMHEGVG